MKFEERTQLEPTPWSRSTVAYLIHGVGSPGGFCRSTVLGSMPEVASHVVRPLAQTARTVMNSRGANGSIGASGLTNDVTNDFTDHVTRVVS